MPGNRGARKSEAIFAGDARQGPRVVDRYRGRILGIAADIGTTTVAMNLVDLETGDILYTASFENPQRFGGSDVMNRISYDTGTYRGELQAVLISSINYEIGEMVRALKIRRRHIVELVAVGNTTMRDILFGIDVEPIGQKPYKSHIETDFTDGKRDTTALNVPSPRTRHPHKPQRQHLQRTHNRLPHRLRHRRRPPNNRHRPTTRTHHPNRHRHQHRNHSRQQKPTPRRLLPRRPSLRRRPSNLRHARLQRSSRTRNNPQRIPPPPGGG